MVLSPVSLRSKCFNIWRIVPNGLQLQEVGDFGDENCLPPRLVPPLRENLIRSTTCPAFAGKFHLPEQAGLTTEPPISCRCCYAFVVFLRSCSSVHKGLSLCDCLVALLNFLALNCVSAKKYKCATKCVGCLRSLCNMCN